MSINLKGQIDDVLKGTVDLLTGGSSAVIESKSIFANGVYNAPSGVDGYNPVVVDVPAKTEKTLSVTENGTYTPEEGQVYNGVIVNVQQSQPVIQSKNITENGTYNAPSGVDGFNPVVVSVPTKEERHLEYTINSNGDYSWTVSSENIYYNPIDITVDVPSYTPIRELYYKPFVEGDMRLTTGLSGDIKSEWIGNSSIGCTIQGTVDLRNYHSVTVKGTITDSYEYLNKTGYDRCQFVCGFTDEVFNSIILVNYNTGDHIVESEMKTLTNQQSINFTIDFDLDEIVSDHLYFFISMLGISGNFETEVR